MKTISVDASSTSTTKISLGRQGEHLATQVVFDCSGLAEDYGEGFPVILHKRAEDSAVYDVNAGFDTETQEAVWSVTGVDTQQCGTGSAELQWYADGGVVKSVTYSTVVLESLSGSLDSDSSTAVWAALLTKLVLETANRALDSSTEALKLAQSSAEEVEDLKNITFSIGEDGGLIVTVEAEDEA